VAQRSPLLPIFLIVLVDVLGFTIVIPLLGLYAEKFGATPLIATLIVSCYAASSLVSTPILGRLSDIYGRRPLLLISQAGTCLGFVILGFSTALWMVFVGRILDGLTAGNLSLAQAYISDHTKPENRAKAFGVIGIAFGIGFMFGPALGGALGEYGMHYPFMVAACLSALSMACTYFLLPREDGMKPKAEVVGPGGKRPGAFDVSVYAEFFRRPELRALYVQFFLFSFSFSLFFSGFALYAERRFVVEHIGPLGQMLVEPWSAREVGYLFAYSGLIGVLWQGGLIGRLVKKFGEIKLTAAGFAASAIAYTLFGFVPEDRLIPLGLVAIVSSFGQSVVRPVLTSRITQAVGRHEQGVAIGITGSLSSLAMMAAPPTGGSMLDHHWLLAWALIPAGVSLLALVIALATTRKATAPA
jgi:DHA1 family tetracycline resistance protein-like MFS transporter